MRSSGRGTLITLGLLGLILILALGRDLVSARTRGPASDDGYRTALTKEGLGIVRSPAPFLWTRGPLAVIPAYDPSDRDPWKVDLRGYDLRKCDLTGRLGDIMNASFDDLTRWPARLPAGFDPVKMTEIGKNPGLGVRDLHERGITGRGVGVAVIDMGFLVDHAEYGGRLRLFEEIHSADETAQMHGVATASIAVGRTVGVAPEADLYYIAHFPESDKPGAPQPERDLSWTAKGIDRILEVNRNLPAGKKIRVISISIGWDARAGQRSDVKAIMEAVGRAKRDGVFVVCTSMAETYGFHIFGLSRAPLRDPDETASYGDALWGSLDVTNAQVLRVPMDSRTAASPTGIRDYAFYRFGGLSWAVPWAAGLYALACQVDPDITPQVFWSKALETGDAIDLPPKEPNLSDAEIERRVQKSVNDGIAKVKSQTRGQDPEAVYAKIFSQANKKDLAKMSEAEFRKWAAGLVRPTILKDTKPRRLEKIVNPRKLIESLGR